MPKCPRCGKKFGSLQALNDHFRSIHPNEKFVAPKQGSSARTLIVIIIIVIIVMGSLVGYLIYLQLGAKPTPPAPICYSCIGQPIPADLYQNISGISSSTLGTIGMGQGVTKPTTVSGPLLTNNSKAEVLYIGAEYCPYCAAERWALVVALSQFGSFSSLPLTLSGDSPEVFPDTATFSFVNSSYTSQYVSFVSVEFQDRSPQHNPLQTITPAEQSLMNQYDSAGSIPFLDVGSRYVVVGAQFQPYTLRVDANPHGTTAPLNWTQIGSQLSDTKSAVAQSIDGSANTLITAICNVIQQAGETPPSLCSQSYAHLSLSISSGLSGQQSTPIISVVKPLKVSEFLSR